MSSFEFNITFGPLAWGAVRIFLEIGAERIVLRI